MNLKLSRWVGVCAVGALLITANASWVGAGESVEYISTKSYFETAQHIINDAQKSIVVYMYLVSYDSAGAKTQPQQLLSALVDAKKRGVDVEVVLDQNIDFTETESAPSVNKAKNLEAYDYLNANGVRVYYDNPHTYTHSKVIIADGRITLLGSTNWTNTGLARNVESNLLVDSEALAESVLNDLKQVPRQSIAKEESKSVSLSWAFTNRPDLVGKMLEAADERAFDLYLYLLKKYDGNAEAKVILDYANAAEALGMGNLPAENYRRQIIKVAKKLDERYRLIEFKPEFGKNAGIILKSLEDSEKRYSYPKMNFLKIPVSYWDYGWSTKLSFPAKVMLLLNLSYAPISKNPPSWFASRKILADRHHLTEHSITEGNTMLRRMNIIEIEYAPYAQKPEERRANTYRFNGLYNPEGLQIKMNELKARYGDQRLERAIKIAQLVYEDSDGQGIKSILESEDKYGVEAVDEAARIIAAKNPDNPKRNIAYLLSAVKHLAKDRVE